MLMKKTIYLLGLLCVVFCAGKTEAQYHITTSNVNAYDTMCTGPTFKVYTNTYSPSLTVTSYFGDGTFSSNPVLNIGGPGNMTTHHPYYVNGIYSVKHILFDGATAVDSVVGAFNYFFCQSLPVNIFFDTHGDCVYDTLTDPLTRIPFVVQVDSVGIPVDTISATSGLRYKAYGVPGTTYAFKILSTPPGTVVSCPSTGVVYETVPTPGSVPPIKYFGVRCSSSSGFDIAEYVSTKAGKHAFYADILVKNSYCTPENATLTMRFSPKYRFFGAYPTPTSVATTTITWDLTALSLLTPAQICVTLGKAYTLADLPFGDTVHSEFTLTPTIGDMNPTNNVYIKTDTVRSSFDPNEKSVSPEGVIHAGTKLIYTVNFENTGNAAAQNIHIMDTLSDNVNPQTLQILASSAVMNTTIFNDGGHNIVKFDFPNINLLDSSHHGQCDGMVVYSVNTKTGLAFGTKIDNRAGIYFDYNPVVMTNTVENTIGNPAGVAVVTNAPDVSIYPNPANSELTIKTVKDDYNMTCITNILGQQLMTQQLSGTETKVNVRALAAGLYYITLKGDAGVKVMKFEKL